MKISIKGYITSKEAELFSDCADRYSINETHHKFAISDGVSKSFFPKFWAEILVDNFVKSKVIDHNTFIKKCQEEWLLKVTEIIKKPDVKWFTSNAFNNKRPGLATFVTLEFFEKEMNWIASSLGDSFMFHIPKELKDFDKQCIILSSKMGPIIFDNFPDYFNSIGDQKGKIKQKSGNLKEGTFYLMTDALSEWFLSEKGNAIDEINVWKNQNDFEQFVNKERISTKLGNDDSAILIIDVFDDKKNEISYSKINVSKINDLASEQGMEIEKIKKIELEKKKIFEEAEKIKKEEEEEEEEEEEKAVKEKKEEKSKKGIESGKSAKANKNKEEGPMAESQPVEQKEDEEHEKTLLEKGKELLFGKRKEKTEETIENLDSSPAKNNELISPEENKVENTNEEITKNPKQEITPKEGVKPVNKKNKKENTPDKNDTINKF
jgi:hypothetical protein